MSRADDASRILIDAGLIGETIINWQCFGINSTKGLLPLSTLNGQRIDDIRCRQDVMIIASEDYSVSIDLARTGYVRLEPALTPWTPVAGARPPTARLLTSGSLGVDFKEPGKTKRITFLVEQRQRMAGRGSA